MRGREKYDLDSVEMWINCACDKKHNITCFTVDTLPHVFPFPIIMPPRKVTLGFQQGTISTAEERVPLLLLVLIK
jgi:hypothetical protein